MLDIFASLQSFGRSPVLRDCCSIICNIGAIGSTKPFWKYIKSKRQDAGGIAPLKKGANLISDSKGKAELLLDQFKSIGSAHSLRIQFGIVSGPEAVLGLTCLNSFSRPFCSILIGVMSVFA
jgi:hypothetical protein